jgi:hypothetical protein
MFFVNKHIHGKGDPNCIEAKGIPRRAAIHVKNAQIKDI